MNEQEQMQWAASLEQARHLASPKPSCPEHWAATVEDAYAVQRFGLAQRPDDPIIGFKGALTNRRVQETFGAVEPALGLLFASADRSGQVIQKADFGRGMIETELGFVLCRPIDQPIESIADLQSCFDGMCLMVELVDLNFGQFPPSLPDLIMHNAAAAQFIQGAVSPIGDPDELTLALFSEGAALHRASGLDVMDGQWKALGWMINQAIALGYALTPGQVLMTGSVGSVHPMSVGAYSLDCDDLEALTFRLG